MWARHGRDVAFFVVYVREAHAIDSEWPMGGPGAPLVEEPRRYEERDAVARACVVKLELEPMPALVDDMRDTVCLAYEAWPDRLVLVDREGRVAYRAAPGPFGFKPDELEEAIRKELAPPAGGAPAPRR